MMVRHGAHIPEGYLSIGYLVHFDEHFPGGGAPASRHLINIKPMATQKFGHLSIAIHRLESRPPVLQIFW